MDKILGRLLRHCRDSIIKPSGDLFAAAVKASSFAITDVVIYAADTDMNKLPGRPGQYIGKASWNDPHVTSKSYETTIELFAGKASMDARFYLRRCDHQEPTIPPVHVPG